jgi:hypothetical protein
MESRFSTITNAIALTTGRGLNNDGHSTASSMYRRPYHDGDGRSFISSIDVGAAR